MEVALMNYLNYRQNIIVPNVTTGSGLVNFETDLLMIRPSGYAVGVEIKVSKSDLMADFKKTQHTDKEFKRGKSSLERYYGKFRHFYYAVPDNMKQIALEVVPSHFGVLYVGMSPKNSHFPYRLYVGEARPAPVMFQHKWSDSDRLAVARLGAMRIYGLKHTARSKYLKELND